MIIELPQSDEPFEIPTLRDAFLGGDTYGVLLMEGQIDIFRCLEEGNELYISTDRNIYHFFIDEAGDFRMEDAYLELRETMNTCADIMEVKYSIGLKETYAPVQISQDLLVSGIKKSELVLEVAIPFMFPNENLYSHTEVCQLHRSFIIEEFLERRASAIAREKTKFTII